MKQRAGELLKASVAVHDHAVQLLAPYHTAVHEPH